MRSAISTMPTGDLRFPLRKARDGDWAQEGVARREPAWAPRGQPGQGDSALTTKSSRGGESLPPTQEENIQVPDDEAKNSHLQGESGLGGGSWRLLKIVSLWRLGLVGPAPPLPPLLLYLWELLMGPSYGAALTVISSGIKVALGGGEVLGMDGENRPQFSVSREVKLWPSICPDPYPESE